MAVKSFQNKILILTKCYSDENAVTLTVIGAKQCKWIIIVSNSIQVTMAKAIMNKRKEKGSSFLKKGDEEEGWSEA